MTDQMERFMDKVSPEPTSGCWLWTGALNSYGYGTFSRPPLNGVRQSAAAHRASYEFFVKPIPVGLVLDHLCRTPACVNPKHLEPVTTGENTRRALGLLVKNAERTECPSGHPLSGDNLYIRPSDGWRFCRICQKRDRRTYLKKWGSSHRKPPLDVAMTKVQRRGLWAAIWYSHNNRDGVKRHILNNENCLPILFRTRTECRTWIAEKYGYIANRPDLQAEPHGWRVPKAAKVIIGVQPQYAAAEKEVVK